MISRKLRLHQEDRLGSHLIPVTINGDLGLKITKLSKGPTNRFQNLLFKESMV